MKVGDVDVRITSPDRVLWPALGLTKLWMIQYYVDVGPALLPHLADHPVTLHRFSNGVTEKHWYQTRAPVHPPWVRTATFRPERTGKVFEVVVIDDLRSLVWAAQIAAIEIHPYLGTTANLDHPTTAVFDLDPGEGVDILACARVALWIREVLASVGLQAWPKTSGAQGLHVVVPLAGTQPYPQVKAFVRTVAHLLVRNHPAEVTDDMNRALRAGRVFVDWSQNDAGKSTVAPYSLRGLTIPTVSTPVTWGEVEAAIADADPAALCFTPDRVLARLGAHGDLSADVLAVAQEVPVGS